MMKMISLPALRVVAIVLLVALFGLVSSFLFIGCTIIRGPGSNETPGHLRLHDLEDTRYPVTSKTQIHWDRHRIPYIEASSDEDAFFALGFAQAHLRLGQMELYRRVAKGEISNLIGPFVSDIDATLRILGIGDAAPAIIDGLSEEELTLVRRFTDGINAYQSSAKSLPFEFHAFGIDPSPWEPEDVAIISRLASIDFSWIIYTSLLSVTQEAEREEAFRAILALLNQDLLGSDATSLNQNSLLSALFQDVGRFGSNSAVISGSRTSSL